MKKTCMQVNKIWTKAGVTNINLLTPLFLYFEMHMPLYIICVFSRLRQMLIFYVTPFWLLWFFMSFKNFTICESISVWWKTSLQTFRVSLSTADFYHVMCMLDCLRSRFCSEFQACTCNINDRKTPYLEKLGKDVSMSFSQRNILRR